MSPAKRKRPNSPTSSATISPETVEPAVRSLLRWRKSLPPSLREEDDFFNLLLYLTEIPHPHTYNIPLPHSLLPKSPNLCLIIDDTHNNEENLTIDVARKKIESDNIPISKILNLSELRSDYKSICDSYDMFFAEKSVISQLGCLMGEKMPMQLDLKNGDWKTQIKNACSCTLLCLIEGNCHVVRVAKVLMGMDEIVDNVIAAIDCIVIVLHNSWKDIEYLQLKLFGSHSLPIYQKIPLSTAPERFHPETVEPTVRKLIDWRESKVSDQEDEFFYIVLYLYAVLHPYKEETHFNKILLPHSFLSESPELCLIVDDRHEKGLSKDDAKKKIKSENISVSDVMELSKLRSDYHSTEARRGLCDFYDLFLADGSVIPLLAGQLEEKVAMPLDLKDWDWKGQIEKACCSTLLCLSNGTYYEVRVAKVFMEKDKIVENVLAAIDGITNVVPNHWGNISSLHLKVLDSLSLPIYQPVPL